MNWKSESGIVGVLPTQCEKEPFYLLLMGLTSLSFLIDEVSLSWKQSGMIQNAVQKFCNERECISSLFRRDGLAVCDSVNFTGDLFYFSEIKENLGVDFFEARTNAYYLDLCSHGFVAHLQGVC